MADHKTRESWFLAAAKAIDQKLFKPAGYELPKYRIGCGWSTKNRAKTGASCFNCKSSDDGTYEIFVSPKQAEPFPILELLVHELTHTVAGIGAKHQKPFIEVMKAVGMIAPWTSSTAGEEAVVVLKVIAEKLGPYPHARLNLKMAGEKKQTTRMIKLQCPKCDYVIRTTRKHLEEKGPPLCPLHKCAFKQADHPLTPSADVVRGMFLRDKQAEKEE